VQEIEPDWPILALISAYFQMGTFKESAFIERDLPPALFGSAAETPASQIPFHVSTATRA